MGRWRRLLIPVIRPGEWPELLRAVLSGILIAATYGVLHDQVTYTIGPEYFTNFKFDQFAYADFAFHDRIFAGLVGVLATWWVGLIAGWLLARRCLQHMAPIHARPLIRKGFVIVFACSLLGSISGYAYGLWNGPDADYSGWNWAFSQFAVTDPWAFMKVAYIHNAGYIGGAIGIASTYVLIRPASTAAALNTSA
ncbi:MAG: hypothetical protein Fues2KO_07430 [Fuerstiella sp.]